MIVLMLATLLLSACKLAEKGKLIEVLEIRFTLEHDLSGEGYRLAEELAGSTIHIYERAIDLVDANRRIVRSITWKEFTEKDEMVTFVDTEKGYSFAYGRDGLEERFAIWEESDRVKFSFKLK